MGRDRVGGVINYVVSFPNTEIALRLYIQGLPSRND